MGYELDLQLVRAGEPRQAAREERNPVPACGEPVATIEWLILAEGLGQDVEGAFTFIGVNQNALLAETLPVVTKRAVIAHIAQDGDDLKEGDEVNADFKVSSPSGIVVAQARVSFTLGTKRIKTLPTELDIPAELALEIKEYGAYTVTVEVEIPGSSPVTRELSLYVLDRSAIRDEAE